MKHIAAVSLSLFTVLTAVAQTSAPTKGHGAVPCGTYLQDRKDEFESSGYVAWTMGYMSAYNTFANGAKVKKIPSRETIHAYLDKHCRENPLDLVQDGVDRLRADLILRQPK